MISPSNHPHLIFWAGLFTGPFHFRLQKKRRNVKAWVGSQRDLRLTEIRCHILFNRNHPKCSAAIVFYFRWAAINWLSRSEREMRGRMFECLLEGFSVPPSLDSLFLPMRLIAGVFTYGRLCGQLWRLLFNYCKLLFAGIASGLTGRLLSINLWFNNPFFDCKSGRWYRNKWLVFGDYATAFVQFSRQPRLFATQN